MEERQELMGREVRRLLRPRPHVQTCPPDLPDIVREHKRKRTRTKEKKKRRKERQVGELKVNKVYTLKEILV